MFRRYLRNWLCIGLCFFKKSLDVSTILRSLEIVLYIWWAYRVTTDCKSARNNGLHNVIFDLLIQYSFLYRSTIVKNWLRRKTFQKPPTHTKNNKTFHACLLITKPTHNNSRIHLELYNCSPFFVCLCVASVGLLICKINLSINCF